MPAIKCSYDYEQMQIIRETLRHNEALNELACARDLDFLFTDEPAECVPKDELVLRGVYV